MQQVAPKYAARIIAEVSQQCIHNLEPAHTIPRLYRRTNREVPQTFSVLKVEMYCLHSYMYILISV